MVQYSGLKAVTISNFLLAKEVKKRIPNVILECSSVAYVDSIQKAQQWADIGCNIMVIPPDKNKNIE